VGQEAGGEGRGAVDVRLCEMGKVARGTIYERYIGQESLGSGNKGSAFIRWSNGCRVSMGGDRDLVLAIEKESEERWWWLFFCLFRQWNG